MASQEYLMKYTRFSVVLRRHIATTVTLLVISSAFHSNAIAQKEDLKDEFGLGAGRIRITSDQLIADSAENSAEFKGNVKAVQENTVITSDRMKLYFKKGSTQKNDDPASDSLLKIVVTGNVEIKFDNRVAVTQEAVYITDDKRLVLKGPGTKISSGMDTITGETITYFREEGRIEVESGQGNRVEAIIYPGAKEYPGMKEK